MPLQNNLPYNNLPELPPKVELESREVLKQALRSARALADLKGTAARLPNARVLMSSIALQEARLSSEVENIVTTNDELYRAAAAGPDGGTDPATKEVLRYREALWYGFSQLGRRPISTNLFIEIVEIIRQVGVGIRNTPGTTLKDARGQVIYTPPEGEGLIRAKLANLEHYLYAEDDIDPLVKLAVLHYQFEAIHPFSDGNGRTGRILNVLFLVECGLLDLPVLYLSDYILRNKSEYYAGLRNVTERADWHAWVLFLLRGLEQTSASTCALIGQILQAMANTSERVRTAAPTIYSKDLIEVVFSNPYTRIAFVEKELGVARPTATAYLRRLSELQLLREQRIGRDLYYVNDSMIEALTLSAPFAQNM